MENTINFNVNPEESYNTLNPREYYFSGNEGILLSDNKIAELEMKFFIPPFPIGAVKLNDKQKDPMFSLSVFFLDGKNAKSHIVIKGRHAQTFKEAVFALADKFAGDLLKGSITMVSKPISNGKFAISFPIEKIKANTEADIKKLKDAQAEALNLGVASPTLAILVPKYNGDNNQMPANYLNVKQGNSLLTLTA